MKNLKQTFVVGTAVLFLLSGPHQCQGGNTPGATVASIGGEDDWPTEQIGLNFATLITTNGVPPEFVNLGEFVGVNADGTAYFQMKTHIWGDPHVGYHGITLDGEHEYLLPVIYLGRAGGGIEVYMSPTQLIGTLPDGHWFIAPVEFLDTMEDEEGGRYERLSTAVPISDTGLRMHDSQSSLTGQDQETGEIFDFPGLGWFDYPGIGWEWQSPPIGAAPRSLVDSEGWDEVPEHLMFAIQATQTNGTPFGVSPGNSQGLVSPRAAASGLPFGKR